MAMSHTVEGLSPELRPLLDDYTTIREMFHDFKRGNAVMPHIIRHVCCRLALEESVLYPIEKRIDQTRGDHIQNELMKKHFPIYRLCQNMLDMNSEDDPEYVQLGNELETSVERHFEATERTLLPELDRLLNDEQKRQLVRAYYDAKKIAPHSPVALVRHLWLVGPDAREYEKLRDSLQHHYMTAASDQQRNVNQESSTS